MRNWYLIEGVGEQGAEKNFRTYEGEEEAWEEGRREKGEWGKLRNEELHNLLAYANTIYRDGKIKEDEGM